MEILSVYGDKVDKITVKKPRDVGQLRELVPKHFEADIRFPLRFMLDSGVYSGFEVPDKKTLVQWRKVKPCEFETQIRFVACDIETFSKGRRFPLATDSDAMVTINCMYDSWSKKYLTFIVNRKVKKEYIEEYAPDHQVIHVPTEKMLLELTLTYLEKTQPDVFTAWSVDYDKEYTETRAKQYKIIYPWKTTNVFDLLKAYKKLYAKSNNELSNVIKEEKLEIPNYQKFKHEMWEAEDLKEAILTNKSHVEAIVKINEKKHLIEFFWDLKRVSGIDEMKEALFHGKLVENLLLRYYNGKWVVPSKPGKEEQERRKLLAKRKVGGKVLTPPFGIFQNVGVFDMSRYYPEMLISQNLSPEPHARGELGIFPQLTLYLIEERLRYDRELKKLTPGSSEWEQMKYRRNSVKFITESIVGYLGSEPSRLYDLDDFNKVTMMGQRGVTFVQKVCDKDGNKVLYIDTDGLTIKIRSIKEAVDYVDKLNNALKDFCKAEGIKRELTLKLDRYFSWIIFKKTEERVDGEWVERGVKKRYAGIITFEDGKEVNYLKIVGFEYVRRDSPPVTKRIQKQTFDMVFSGKQDQVADYLKTEVTDIKRKYADGILNIDEIAIPVTLNQPISSYGGKNIRGGDIGIPDYVRGAIYSNEWFGTEIRGGDQVKLLFIKDIKGCPKTDARSYLNLSDIPTTAKFTIDIEKMLDRIVKQKIEDIIDVIGISWDEIFNKQRNLFEV
jgi:DNA polymerase, archaea type